MNNIQGTDWKSHRLSRDGELQQTHFACRAATIVEPRAHSRKPHRSRGHSPSELHRLRFTKTKNGGAAIHQNGR